MKKIHTYYAIIFLLLSLSMTARSQSNDLETHYCLSNSQQPLARFIQYLRDPLKNTTIDNIKDGVRLTDVDSDQIDFGFTNDQFWLRVPIENCSSDIQQQLLATNLYRAGHLKVYLQKDNKFKYIFDKNTPGASIKNLSKYRSLSFPVTLAPSERAVFWVEVIPTNIASFPFEVVDANTRGFDILKHQNQLTAVAAGIFALILLNAILLIFTQLKIFLYYTILESINLFYLAHVSGWTTIYLWGDNIWDTNAAGVIAVSGFLMAAEFTREYFSTATRSKSIDRPLKIVIWICYAWIFAKTINIFFPFISAAQINQIGYPIVAAISIITVTTAVKFTLKNSTERNFQLSGDILVLIALIIIVANFILMSLRTTTLLPYNQDTDLTFGIILLIDSICIAIALAIRIRRIYFDRETALKDNIELQKNRIKQQRREQQLLLEKSTANHSATEAGKLILAMGHDSRQMLSAIQNYAGLLENQSDPSIQNRISKSIQQASQLLNDTFSNAMDAGDITDRDALPSTLTLERIYAPLELIYKHEAWQKNIQLKFSTRDVNRTIVSDRAFILRILGNFISNAIRHTDQGCIYICCRIKKGFITFQVRDSGCGIADHKLDEILSGEIHLTESYKQKSNLGIGLKGANTLAKNIGGEIKIRSEINTGTTAELIIPNC